MELLCLAGPIPHIELSVKKIKVIFHLWKSVYNMQKFHDLGIFFNDITLDAVGFLNTFFEIKKKVPLHSYFEEKRKRMCSQHWISHKTFKMQRFCQSYISKNWKFLIFFNFFKCAYQIFNILGNINHQNGSETCPKRTKNSQTKGFPESA